MEANGIFLELGWKVSQWWHSSFPFRWRYINKYLGGSFRGESTHKSKKPDNTRSPNIARATKSQNPRLPNTGPVTTILLVLLLKRRLMLGPPVSATIAIATTATAVDTKTTATTATTIACKKQQLLMLQMFLLWTKPFIDGVKLSNLPTGVKLWKKTGETKRGCATLNLTRQNFLAPKKRAPRIFPTISCPSFSHPPVRMHLNLQLSTAWLKYASNESRSSENQNRLPPLPSSYPILLFPKTPPPYPFQAIQAINQAALLNVHLTIPPDHRFYRWLSVKLAMCIAPLVDSTRRPPRRSPYRWQQS